jgi:hypothetical protein
MKVATRIAVIVSFGLVTTSAFAVSPLIRQELRAIEREKSISVKKLAPIKECVDFTGIWEGSCQTKLGNKPNETPVKFEIKQYGCDGIDISGRYISFGESETTSISSETPGTKSISTVEFSDWSEDRRGFFSDFVAAIAPSNFVESGKNMVTIRGQEVWKMQDNFLIKTIDIADRLSAECSLTK